MQLPAIIKSLITSRDGQSFDIIRIGTIVGATSVIVFTGYDITANKSHFNAVEFGTGFGSVLALGGAGIGLKRKDEPEAS